MKAKISIRKVSLYYIITLCLFSVVIFMPVALTRYRLFEFLSNIGQVLFFVYSAVLYRNSGRRSDKTEIVIVATYIAFHMVLLFSDLINGTFGMKHIQWGCINLGILFHIFSLSNERIKDFLYGIGIPFGVLSFLQLCSLFMKPDGLYKNVNNVKQYFWADNNSVMQYVLILVTIAILLYIYGNRRISSFSIMFLCISLTLSVVSKSGTGLACTVMLILMYLFQVYIKQIRLLYVLVGLVFVFFIIVVIQSYNSSWLQYIVVGLLGKNLEFTGRIYIWSESIRVWLTSPVYGIGIGRGGNGVYFLGHWHGAHNMYLQILVDGGLLSLILYLIPPIVCALKITHCKKTLQNKILVAGIFAIELAMMFEIYNSGWPLVMLTALYYKMCVSN